MNPKKNSGFTLIELLVVIGILAVLFSIVLIAINPARQFNQANNAKRRSDVIALLNAISQYRADLKGALPAGITTTVANISNTGSDICADIMGPQLYLPALPQDPAFNNGAQITDCTVAYDTNYTVVQDASGRVTVAAPSAALGEVISVTR
ncbi:prepilin-type N-terminal cleavage/methylation domain-containing protein [Candidatus Gottesmanbacteria bacterium]|nr:prepilin-type N-terminal cleavage/methylation domain-containing protein [Candidatus Gottesmanbacteria bacterium]